MGWQRHQLDHMQIIFAPCSRHITMAWQHLITQFFTGRMLFLMPNQQCGSTKKVKAILEDINPPKLYTYFTVKHKDKEHS